MPELKVRVSEEELRAIRRKTVDDGTSVQAVGYRFFMDWLAGGTLSIPENFAKILTTAAEKIGIPPLQLIENAVQGYLSAVSTVPQNGGIVMNRTTEYSDVTLQGGDWRLVAAREVLDSTHPVAGPALLANIISFSMLVKAYEALRRTHELSSSSTPTKSVEDPELSAEAAAALAAAAPEIERLADIYKQFAASDAKPDSDMQKHGGKRTA